MVSLAKRTQRGSVALSPSEYRCVAIRDLFRLYAGHDPFRAALGNLSSNQRAALTELTPFRGQSFAWIESRPNPSDAVTGYVAAVHDIAALWGLDKIGTVPVPGEPFTEHGTEAVHRWAELAHLDSEEMGKSFGFGLPMPSSYPGIDTAIHGVEGAHWNPEEEPRSDSEQIIPERHRALYGWQMRLYQEGARSRIAARVNAEGATPVDAELDRIQGEYEALGYPFPDSQPRYDDVLKWTFRRLALRDAVVDIAREADLLEPNVRKHLAAMQKRLGIERFPKARRKRYIHSRTPD